MYCARAPYPPCTTLRYPSGPSTHCRRLAQIRCKTTTRNSKYNPCYHPQTRVSLQWPVGQRCRSHDLRSEQNALSITPPAITPDRKMNETTSAGKAARPQSFRTAECKSRNLPGDRLLHTEVSPKKNKNACQVSAKIAANGRVAAIRATTSLVGRDGTPESHHATFDQSGPHRESEGGTSPTVNKPAHMLRQLRKEIDRGEIEKGKRLKDFFVPQQIGKHHQRSAVIIALCRFRSL